MSLFVDYILPLTDWLQSNPHWALFFTFIISLGESLAIIGSIVPGSITMTAIGIMAGSGIMRIDLTLVAAILGAVTGDGLSYALGYFYSDQLTEMWPFNKYPNWLKYGKEFFDRHGGKSVFLGRFVGPLRSIIPVIAGIMHMPQWRFFLANFFSAIGWSILYVIPGVLIGAASHELSAESASKLIFLIFVLLIGIWLLTLVLKWFLIKASIYLKTNLHHLWLNLKKHPALFQLINAITPKDEENHYTTVALLILLMLSFISSIIFVILTIEGHSITVVNTPIHLFLQSFHTNILEAFFITCTQLTSSLSLTVLFISASIWFIYYQTPRAIAYVLSLIFSSAVIATLLSYFIYNPRPPGILVAMQGSSFPSVNLTIGTAFFVFLLFYIRNQYSLFANSLRSFLFILLGLNGVGVLYLGDYWLTDLLASYCCGATIGLLHCLIYRKHTDDENKPIHSSSILYSLITLLLVATSLSTYINFKQLIHNHTPYHKEFTLAEQSWWNQQTPILPLYRFNRIGKRISLLNIQYSGEIELLQKSLTDKGWVLHNETLFNNLMTRIGSNTEQVKLPLFAQLFENKKPELLMTYHVKKSHLYFELRIWESNYYLSGTNKPIWIGSVHLSQMKKKSSKNPNVASYLLPALTHFSIRRIELPEERIQNTAYAASPIILLIK